MKNFKFSQTLSLKKMRFLKPFLKPKTASISEPRFGGHRKLTNGWVSVRCPPNRGSENEADFGFSFLGFRPFRFIFWAGRFRARIRNSRKF